jgi:hypothetical protein
VPEPEERPFPEQVAELFAEPLEEPRTVRVSPRCAGCDVEMTRVPDADRVWPIWECSSCGMGVEVRFT